MKIKKIWMYICIIMSCIASLLSGIYVGINGFDLNAVVGLGSVGIWYINYLIVKKHL